MQILAAVVGLALIVVILADGFEVMVLPRRLTWPYQPTRLFYRAAWSVWRMAACLLPPSKRRQNLLSIFGPLSMLVLLTAWVTGLVLGFALLHTALATPLIHQTNGPVDEESGLFTYFYFSGVTFFTLGFGDVTAASRPRSVPDASLEAGMGFGFLAVVIGYLPVLYQAFSRREVGPSRCWTPAPARRRAPASCCCGWPVRQRASTAPRRFLVEWERWAAELLESHLSFPVLSYYRSQHDNQSWLAALTAILDTCALLLARCTGRGRRTRRG